MIVIMNNRAYRGSCLCGKVHYEIKQFQPQVGHCHCRMCRKFHGAAFSTLGEVSLDEFSWTEGQSVVASYVAENGTIRQFCSNCGSSLTFQSPAYQSKEIEVSLATLDDEVDLSPNAHIYVDSRACWYDITDGLPQYGEYRNGEILNLDSLSESK